MARPALAGSRGAAPAAAALLRQARGRRAELSARAAGHGGGSRRGHGHRAPDRAGRVSCRPMLVFRATVSAGTYLRALARDLGERLGVGAHLTALRREAIGPLRVEDAVPLERSSRGGPAGPRGARPPARVGARRDGADRGEPRTGSAGAMPRPRATSRWCRGELVAVARAGGRLAPALGRAGDAVTGPAAAARAAASSPSARSTGCTWGTRRCCARSRDGRAAAGRASVLVTFEPHPLEVVNPQAAPPLLTTGAERREMLAQLPLDYALLPAVRPAAGGARAGGIRAARCCSSAARCASW